MSRHTSKLFRGYFSLYPNRVNVTFPPQVDRDTLTQTFRDATGDDPWYWRHPLEGVRHDEECMGYPGPSAVVVEGQAACAGQGIGCLFDRKVSRFFMVNCAV